MKKQLTAIFLVFALLLTMASCSTAQAIQALDRAEEKIDANLDAAEEKLEQRIRESMAPAPAAEPVSAPVPAAEPTVPAPAEPANALTEEQAVQIALDYAGFTADQISRLRVEYEIDDRIPQYDIEFHQGDWEYEFEIHGQTGQILSFDKDHKYD